MRETVPNSVWRPWEMMRALGDTLLACGAALALLGVALAAETPPKGYLSNSGPPGLRFRSPPKPAVLWLNPQPITYTPPPALVTEFATPPRPVHAALLNTLPAAALAPAATVPESFVAASTNRTAVMTNLARAEVITGEVLVKYFSKVKSNRLEVPLAAPIHFIVPIREANPPKSPDPRKK